MYCECLDCGSNYHFDNKPIQCPNCKGSNFRRVDNPFIDDDEEEDREGYSWQQRNEKRKSLKEIQQDVREFIRSL